MATLSDPGIFTSATIVLLGSCSESEPLIGTSMFVRILKDHFVKASVQNFDGSETPVRNE